MYVNKIMGALLAVALIILALPTAGRLSLQAAAAAVVAVSMMVRAAVAKR